MGAGIREEIESLDPTVQELLERHHFDRARFEALAEALRSGEAHSSRVTAVEVRPPAEGDLDVLPEPGSGDYARLEALGLAALASGRCALCVMVGGMATRMGGVTKALVRALPEHTFLDLKLLEAEAIERRVGTAPPLWLMTSHATDSPLRDYLGSRVDGERIALFPQNLALGLTREGGLFRDESGAVQLRAPGHGDLPDALKRSGLLEPFISRGGRIVVVANVDNLGATLDPAILGWHLSHPSPVTLEIVAKVAEDRGGVPVRVDGELVTLEEFCLPEDFDPRSVPVFSTNTFLFDAGALRELSIPWTFHRVEKSHGSSQIVQFERVLNEVTRHLRTRHLAVPRSGPGSRFIPVKNPDELVTRRAEIEHSLRTRGILP